MKISVYTITLSFSQRFYPLTRYAYAYNPVTSVQIALAYEKRHFFELSKFSDTN
jgi:hypothetical protein